MHMVARLLLVVFAAAALPAQTFNGKTATEWVQELGADDEETRERAVQSLVIMRERAVRATLRALDDERPQVRANAALALGWLGAIAAEGRDKLVALQADSDVAVAHAAAVAALRVRVDAAALPERRAAAGSGDWDLQLAAAEVLQQLGRAAQSATPELIALLASSAQALDRTHVVELQRAPTQYWNVRGAAARALGAIGPVDGQPVGESLRALLRHREWAAREGAVEALAGMPSEEANVLALLRVLQEDDVWSVRRAAAETLTAVVPVGHALLTTVVPRMIVALGDQDGGVRRLAAAFLGDRGEAAASAVDDLAAMLRARDRSTREYGLQALRALGPVAAAARDDLLAYYHSVPEDQDHVRREVLEALAVVAPAARSELPELDALLVQRSATVPPAAVRRQQHVVKALAALQEKEFSARAEVLDLLVRERITEAIPHLLQWLDAGRPLEERLAAVGVLTALDAESIVPLVRPLLAVDDAAARFAAALSLAMFGDEESATRVVEVLTENLARSSKDQLWFLGMTMVPGLAPHLERIVADVDAEPQRRWGALQALRYLRQKSSTPVVVALLDEAESSKALSPYERAALLSLGLGTLAALDPGPHRAYFDKHAESDESEVRQAALAGLVELGEAQAKAELGRGADEPAIPAALRERLAQTRLRLVQVRHATLRSVLALLTRELGIPVALSPDADPVVLDERFDGMYFELLGFRPSAREVLGVVGNEFFFRADLDVRYREDRIDLVPKPGAAGGRRR